MGEYTAAKRTTAMDGESAKNAGCSF